METLSEAMNSLRKEDYTSNISPDELKSIDPALWEIDHIYRFEGMSNPDDNSILYAVSKKDGSRKAVLVNAYGVYADSGLNLFIGGLKTSNHKI